MEAARIKALVSYSGNALNNRKKETQVVNKLQPKFSVLMVGYIMTWFDILKGRSRSLINVDILDPKTGLEPLITKLLVKWLRDNNEDHPIALGDEPQVIGHTPQGQDQVLADHEDDFYIQIYLKDTSNSKMQPIGTYLWDSMSFTPDDRMIREMSGRAIRNIVPTAKQREWQATQKIKEQLKQQELDG